MLEGGGLSAGCLSGDDRKLKIAFMVTETREDTGDTKKLKLKWLFEQKKGATNGRKRGLTPCLTLSWYWISYVWMGWIGLGYTGCLLFLFAAVGRCTR